MSKLLSLSCLIGLTALVYAQTWRAGFVYEDVRSVIANPQVQQKADWTPRELRAVTVLSYRLNHAQLLKVGYEWPHRNGTLSSDDNILGVQLVTSISAISKAFH